MALLYKVLKASNREMYLYYPGEQNRTPYKRCSITVLLERCTRADVQQALEAWGLQSLAEEQELVLCFPVPLRTGWNDTMEPSLPDDIAAFHAFQDGMSKPDDEPLAVNEMGIPTLESMLCTWHPMNDTKYVIGVGSGASMALTLAACAPDQIAAVLAVGGRLCAQAIAKAIPAPMPLWLTQRDEATLTCFRASNDVQRALETTEAFVWQSLVNPLQTVTLLKNAPEMGETLLQSAWQQLFSKVRRVNTGAHGDIEHRMPDVKTLMACHIEERVLADGLAHTWFVHVPAAVKANPQRKVPAVFFYHGGSDNPAEAAEMSKFHELGEREGFITVYPWATNRCGWNSSMLPDQEDDVEFCALLIDHLIANEPVDATRIYLSGFSNGAAQAQAVALIHPEKVAAICHIDSNWPGKRGGYLAVEDRDVIPFERGMAHKAEADFRMPVWYTYGSRELSYPVYRGSTQQNQYDFWKRYNHVPVKPTPAQGEPNPTGCGVAGDVQETLAPCTRHPHHTYQVQRFWSQDAQPLNLYNYVVMHDKGHEVAPMDAALGWAYVRQFRRELGGSLGIVQPTQV